MRSKLAASFKWGDAGQNPLAQNPMAAARMKKAENQAPTAEIHRASKKHVGNPMAATAAAAAANVQDGETDGGVGGDWQTCADPNNGGHLYYYNHATQETS